MTSNLPTRFKMIALLLSVLAAGAVRAELRPELEMGIGVGGVNFPIYRGAEERRYYLLPVPYFDYHGEYFEVNRERVRGLIYRSDPLEVDLDFSGSVPVNSSSTTARNGMPDIDAILEVGPRAVVHLYADERKQTNLDLRLPLRAALPVRPYRIDHQGWVFQPTLSLDLRNLQRTRWNLGLQAGLVYGDQTYHQYFYEVAPEFATATRPAYSASGGYGGAQYTATLSRRHDGMWMGAFVKWDNLNGAVFEDSPLVTRKQSFAIGFAISWVLFSSEKMVEVRAD